MSAEQGKPMTKAALLAGLRAFGTIDKDQRAAVVCALVGHSKIVSTCFGYVNCARCGAQIGDTLGGASTLQARVIVGHKCKTCETNYAALGWRDKLYTPDPFAEVKP